MPSLTEQALRDVFVSYNEKDSKASMEIVAALEKRGISCWVAPRDVRATMNTMQMDGNRSGWEEAITYAIERCRVMVIVVSEHSTRSEHVKNEINIGQMVGIEFFPVRLEDIPLLRAFPYHLARAQWHDCFGSAPERFSALVESVAGCLHGPSVGNPQGESPKLDVAVSDLPVPGTYLAASSGISENGVGLQDDQTAYDQAVAQARTIRAAGGSKAKAAEAIANRLPNTSRRIILKAFQEGAELTPSGASTYLYNIQAKTRKNS